MLTVAEKYQVDSLKPLVEAQLTADWPTNLADWIKFRRAEEETYDEQTEIDWDCLADIQPFPEPASVVLELSGSGEKFAVVFVERDSHDAVRLVKCEFDTISVVDVNVDVEHSGMVS